jgi:superfamily II RNA helicase
MNLQPYLKDLEEKRFLDSMEKSKEVQKQISQWNNKHMGPQWNKAIKNYSEYLELQRFNDKSNDEIEHCNHRILIFKTNIEVLEKLKLIEIKDEKLTLTNLGVLATEINEANPLLLISLYSQNIINDLSSEEIVSLIAMFIESCAKDVEINTSHQFYSLYQKLIEHQSEIKKVELYESSGSFWKVNFDLVEPMLKWFKGESIEFICSEFSIFPGNFYRSIMTFHNILEELITICEIDSNVMLLEKLNNIKPNILKNVIIDSLYLKL